MICDPLHAPNTINHTHSRSRLAAGSPPGRQAFGDLTFPEVAPESAAGSEPPLPHHQEARGPSRRVDRPDRRLSRSLTEPSQAIALQMIMRERTSRRQTQTFRSGCIEPANIAGRAMRRVSLREQVWSIGDHHESSVLCHSDWSPYAGRRHGNACGRVF